MKKIINLGIIFLNGILPSCRGLYPGGVFFGAFWSEDPGRPVIDETRRMCRDDPQDMSFYHVFSRNRCFQSVQDNRPVGIGSILLYL
jgi:hypothetical protein